MANRGRPTDNPANNQFRVRLTNDELNKLNECSKQLNMSKSDVLRKGLDKMHKGLSKNR